jgi:NAD(P)-dependent dehydrogenase (short-subunit alcohol dehydrogenase family)
VSHGRYSGNIGAAIACDLAARGWRVGVHYRRSAADADAVVTRIRDMAGIATALSGDLASISDVSDLIERCSATLGAPTCLINNASEFREDTLATLTPEQWDTHMDANLRAPVFLARAMAARLPEGASGNVINIIDQRAWRLTPEFFSYTLSKSALWSATQMLAQALAPRIRVNAIAPGPVLPNPYQEPADFEAEWRGTLLNRPATPEQIAACVRFILDAPAMTGQMIGLDSGQHLVWK